VTLEGGKMVVRALSGSGVHWHTTAAVGDTVWVTQQRNQNGPFPNPFTIKAVRVN